MAGDFADFDIEDFAFDETFQHWVLETDQEHQAFWNAYLASHPEQTDKILAARALVLDLKAASPVIQDQEMVREIWDHVQRRTQPARFVLWGRLRLWHVAASVLFLAVGLGAWFLKSKTIRQVSSMAITGSDDQFQEKINKTGEVMRIQLGDGSVVSLSRDSRLLYPREFGSKERVVHLTGEAFFEVKRDTERPFLIYANETVTKVLGTSFRIKAYVSAPKVIVSVVTGKVSVFGKDDYEQNPKNPRLTGLVLTANQQAEFSREEQHFNKTLVEKPVVLESEAPYSFEFDNAPLQEVFKILEKAYGVEILYDPELVKGRSLKVSLEDESLYEKLNVICKTMGMSYQVVDARILIEKQDVGSNL